MKISMHGGHSGQFCDHARDTLAAVVEAYATAGFTRVGLSEHMPPESDAWLYPDERELGRSAVWMQERFARYVGEARRLQEQYAGGMAVLVGMETEWYPGAGSWAQVLRERYALEYVVGSVHHVLGVCFDYSRTEYTRAVAACGGLPQLYAAYFDAQEAMLREIRPEVVGHFDLIRLHDPRYRETMTHPLVWPRILRNLELVRQLPAVLDVNARALLKGQPEPYVSASILDAAAGLGVRAVYGDDAHGVTDVGCCWDACAAHIRLHGQPPATTASVLP